MLIGVIAAMVALVPGTAAARSLAENQCAVATTVSDTFTPPNVGTPQAAYGAMRFFGGSRSLRDTAVVINQDFPFVVNMSWTVYHGTFQFPSSFISSASIVPDQGNVNPVGVPGVPIFARNRHFRILLMPSDMNPQDLPPSLRLIPNRLTWDVTQPARLGIQATIRYYNALAGYDKTGTHPERGTVGLQRITWPDVRTVDIHTGRPVPCGDVQFARNAWQRLTPWDERGLSTQLPATAFFPGLGTPNRQSDTTPPKPNPDLVEFFRSPPTATGLPNVASPPDGCSNYVIARLDQQRIALVRVPLVPNTQAHNPPRSALYENTDVQAYSFAVYGRNPITLRNGRPRTGSVGNEWLRPDATGGTTLVIWPRTLNAAQQQLVFRKARQEGWVLLMGNLDGALYPDQAWVRSNGTLPTYPYGQFPNGFRNGVPCPRAATANAEGTLSPFDLQSVPEDTGWFTLGSEWASAAKARNGATMQGPAAPQGVQCGVAEYLGDRCLNRLKTHIADTGGSYFAPSS